jgi:hypothetical protein
MLECASPPLQMLLRASVIEHPNFNSYLQGLRGCDLLFVPDSTETASGQLASYAGQARLHRFGRRSACIGLDTFSARDLPMLRSICGSVLVRRIGSGLSTEFPGDTPVRRMESLGFRIFFEDGSNGRWMSGLRCYRLIKLIEFAVSSPLRLAEYPAITNGTCFSLASIPGRPALRNVIVLDLVQDFEVLRPLLLKCATSSAWSDTRVSVSELMATSHIWKEVNRFLVALRIPWFHPIGPVDVVNALGCGKGGKGVLITASESTARNHRFSHEVCRMASPRTVKITVQHGYECVGLRHHRGHDRAFPRGVRFASDYVLTWAHLDALPDLHPADRGKCIPVGVVKGFAEEVATGAEGGELPDRVPFPVLIAENLHSTRFVDPARYKRFHDFILDVNDGDFALTIRSHPARRTLQKGKHKEALTFLTGDLRAKELRQFGIVVSPPSTILLDAVLAGVPAAIWSEQVDLGDCENYPGIPSVGDLADFAGLCNDRKAIEGVPEANYRWAAQNVCAFNGVPQAWSRLNEIIGS